MLILPRSCSLWQIVVSHRNVIDRGKIWNVLQTSFICWRHAPTRPANFSSILPSYGTAGSMIPRCLFCLFLCTAAPPAGFSIYIFIDTTVTFIGTSGHSVQMYWIFVSTRIFIFSLEIADIFILPWYHAL